MLMSGMITIAWMLCVGVCLIIMFQTINACLFVLLQKFALVYISTMHFSLLIHYSVVAFCADFDWMPGASFISRV